MNNHIEIYENVVSNKLCKFFIDYFEEQDEIGNTFNGMVVGNRVNKNVKDSDDCQISLYPYLGDPKFIHELDNLILAFNPTVIYPISDKGKLASIINFSSSGTISATVTPGVTIAPLEFTDINFTVPETGLLSTVLFKLSENFLILLFNSILSFLSSDNSLFNCSL